jgi:hypothetical protein
VGHAARSRVSDAHTARRNSRRERRLVHHTSDQTFADQRIIVHSGPLPTDDPILELAPDDAGFSSLTFDGIKLAEGAHHLTLSNLTIADPTPVRVLFPLNL